MRMLVYAAAGLCASLFLVPPASAGTGAFTSSDGLLNQIYTASVNTAEDMVSDPVNLWPGGCSVPPSGKIILDGVVRDRCVYTADMSVTGQTLLLAGDDPTVFRNMILMFAGFQKDDGVIPPSACLCSDPAIDYTGYWLIDLYDYVLATGDLDTLHRVWPNVLRALDRWYPSTVDPDNGLVANIYGARSDYALLDRHSAFIDYYNAEYVYVLDLAATMARWIDAQSDSARWALAARAFSAKVLSNFWDPAAGAFKDSVSGPLVHGQDDNAFSVLAGIGSSAQGVSAMNYLDAHNHYGYGNSMADVDVWGDPVWGDLANMRVYSFMSYYELLARFGLNLDASALDLIRREWSYMVKIGPGTMWEDIGQYGSRPTDRNAPSYDHGWSSGAAPVLTEYVLGVQPTSPGFATFTVTPHVGDLSFARGAVPTPHGLITVSWKIVNGRPVIAVTAPAGTTWTNPPPASSKSSGVVKRAGRSCRRSPKERTRRLEPRSAGDSLPVTAGRPSPGRTSRMGCRRS